MSCEVRLELPGRDFGRVRLDFVRGRAGRESKLLATLLSYGGLVEDFAAASDIVGRAPAPGNVFVRDYLAHVGLADALVSADAARIVSELPVTLNHTFIEVTPLLD